VHPVVDARELVQRETTRCAKLPPRTGSGLNRRTSTLSCAARPAKQPVLAGGVQVVEQDAARARRGRRRPAARAGTRGRGVVGDDVVLDVERLLGAADQGDAGAERLGAVGQQAKARDSRPRPPRSTRRRSSPAAVSATSLRA
jgi:hypothetical protein